jgi:hypothetical protein
MLIEDRTSLSSGRFSRHGYSHDGSGIIGVILIVVVVTLLIGRR